MTKNCGECKHCTDKKVIATCKHVGITTGDVPGSDCKWFEPKVITNGDKIIKQGNNGLAAFACGLLNDKSEETFLRVLSFLNAPVESEGEDE